MRKKIDFARGFGKTREMLDKYGLNTVCDWAKCPNKFECYNNLTSTVMVLGRYCTRGCAFCGVDKNIKPEAVEPDEPYRLACYIKEAGLKYVVITSVTRDDLQDGGASHIAECAVQVKNINPNTEIELLVPDFSGAEDSIRTVCKSPVKVIGHNLETVPGLYKTARTGADYERSLGLIRKIKEFSLNKMSKSSIILGLGENFEEVAGVLRDLADAGCDIVVMGQYLKSGARQMDVARFVTPEEFDFLRNKALGFGIKKVFSGPWYRSSYRAEEMAGRT